MRCSRRGRGFTLIEVLVALAVISISLIAVAGEMIQMLDMATTMRQRTFASWIAYNKIAEMRLENVLPEVSSSSGDVKYAGVEWDWRAVVSETAVENLYRVDVTISLPGEDPLMRPVTGFIGEPVPPGQSNRAWDNVNRSPADTPQDPGVRQ